MGSHFIISQFSVYYFYTILDASKTRSRCISFIKIDLRHFQPFSSVLVLILSNWLFFLHSCTCIIYSTSQCGASTLFHSECEAAFPPDVFNLHLLSYTTFLCYYDVVSLRPFSCFFYSHQCPSFLPSTQRLSTIFFAMSGPTLTSNRFMCLDRGHDLRFSMRGYKDDFPNRLDASQLAARRFSAHKLLKKCGMDMDVIPACMRGWNFGGIEAVATHGSMNAIIQVLTHRDFFITKKQNKEDGLTM